MRKLIVPTFFVAALITGYWLAVESWNGQVFVYVGEQRAPASARSLGDFSAIDRRAITQTLNKQLLAQAKVEKLNGFLGVSLGHPVLRRAKGGGEFACGVQGRHGLFDRVELVFTGMGVSESGSQPQLVVEGGCVASRNLERMRTIWIPMESITRSKAKDQEMQLFEDQPTTVRLQQIPGQWPESWVLTSVKLYREANSAQSISIDHTQVREASPKLLSLSWPYNQ